MGPEFRMRERCEIAEEFAGGGYDFSAEAHA